MNHVLFLFLRWLTRSGPPRGPNGAGARPPAAGSRGPRSSGRTGCFLPAVGGLLTRDTPWAEGGPTPLLRGHLGSRISGPRVGVPIDPIGPGTEASGTVTCGTLATAALLKCLCFPSF